MNTDFLNNLDNYIKLKRYRLINSVLVYEYDKLVFERYYNRFSETSRNNLKSVWKSILSITLGICIDKGLIPSVDEPICAYLPEFAGNIHSYHKLITVRHLLTMSSGIYFTGGVHYHCPMIEQMMRAKDWIAYIADVAMDALPGTKFVYKEWDVILLSALIGRACGGSAWDVCGRYLYEPLEIDSGKWPQSACGVNYTILPDERDSDLSARDLAKIGLLFLHGGEWDGRQVVSREYVKAAVSPSGTNPGYGFLWWRFRDGFAGRGFGGQELNVYPARNTVTVLQATATPSSKWYGDISRKIIREECENDER